jgi:riboflavin biosynthesis pyrimidine reductase
VWIVGGGDLAGQFADVGLLDEVIVSIAPVTLGEGASLLPRRIELRLDELGRNGDFACAKFSVVRPRLTCLLQEAAKSVGFEDAIVDSRSGRGHVFRGESSAPAV